MLTNSIRPIDKQTIDHYYSKLFISNVDFKSYFIFVVPLDETNKQFYNQIYSGQNVSFGKIHKEYQG